MWTSGFSESRALQAEQLIKSCSATFISRFRVIGEKADEGESKGGSGRFIRE